MVASPSSASGQLGAGKTNGNQLEKLTVQQFNLVALEFVVAVDNRDFKGEGQRSREGNF